MSHLRNYSDAGDLGLDVGAEVAKELINDWWMSGQYHDDALLPDTCLRCVPLSVSARRSAAGIVVEYFAQVLPAALRRSSLELADEQAALAVAVASFDAVQWKDGRLRGI